MASWKKIIVSGSNAHLTAVTASNLTNDNLLIAGAGGEIEGSGLTYNGTLLNLGSANIQTTGVVSGSQFSGSFFGDGSALTGIATTLDIAGSDNSEAVIDMIDKGIQFTTGSNAAGFTFTTGSVVTVGANNYRELILNAPQNLSTTANVQFAQVDIGGTATLSKASNDALVIDAGQGIVIPQVSSSLTPTVDVAFDLGASSLKWENVYARNILKTALVETGHVSASNSLQITAAEITATIGNGDVTFNVPSANAVVVDGGSFSATGDASVGGDLTVTGDLLVSGDTVNVNTTNLDIEDRYILLNSGSSTIGDSGIIFGGSTGVQSSGSALVWDGSYNSNDGRLAVVGDMGSTDNSDVTPTYHVAGVVEGNAAAAETAQADHPGNIRIDGDDIFIYV